MCQQAATVQTSNGRIAACSLDFSLACELLTPQNYPFPGRHLIHDSQMAFSISLDIFMGHVSCFSKIQIGFTFLVLAHPGSPGQRAVRWVCVSVCVSFSSLFYRTTYVSRYKKDKTSLDLNEATDIMKLVAWLSGRTSVSGRRTFPVLRSTCS